MGQESIDYYASAVWLLKLTLPVCIVGYRTKTLNSLNVVESCTDQCHLHKVGERQVCTTHQLALMAR